MKGKIYKYFLPLIITYTSITYDFVRFINILNEE